MPSAPDCDAKATPPCAGAREANVALRQTSGAVLITPKQFGPTTRIPPRWARSSSSRCNVDAVGADLRESGGNHNEPLHTLASAGVDCVDALGGRDSEDSEVDRSVDRLDARRAREAEQLSGLRVDRVHRSLEASVDEVADDRMSDALRVASRADDRDRLRLQDPGDAGNSGCPGATLARRQ